MLYQLSYKGEVIAFDCGAQSGTRTRKTFQSLRPERSASANFAIGAYIVEEAEGFELGPVGACCFQGNRVKPDSATLP